MFIQKFDGKIYLSLLAATFISFVAATTTAATKLIDIAAGASPSAVAVNAASNKIYIANNGGSTVTVVDGATKQKNDVTVGLAPVDIGVHPALNRVYVVNRDSDNLTVLHGDSNRVLATIPVGDFPLAVAVNPLTNRVYVVNNNSNSVTVIDALTNTVLTTVAVLNFPGAIAVNTVTDKIYVANSFSGKVTRILGASNTAAHINVGGSPSSLAVNQTTNKIYVTNETDGTISVIDGATDAVTATVSVGALPHAVAVNPVTNKIYVANSNSTVSIINGATVSVLAVAATAAQPGAIAVNPTTDQIFTADSSGSVTVIDGATNAATGNVIAGNTPHDIAVNPVTNEVFVSNINGGNVSVIEDAADSVTNIPVVGFTTNVAVNPVTSKAYVGYESRNIITVIRPDNTTAVINLPTAVQDIAVNPITNRIYAALTIGSAVIIDGATDSVITTLATGVNSTDVEVNHVTNKIYVSNANAASVTVIDGATNAAANIAVCSSPLQIAINQVTNKIYVACVSGGVRVIDGATNAVTNINIGNQIPAIAVNPLTNKIYAAGGNTINSFVIDGATNAVTTVPLGASTGAIGVEVSTHSNKAYFFHALSSRISVINGATNAASPLFVSTSQPIQIEANPATGKLYILRSSQNALGELDETTGAFKTIPVGSDPRSLDFNPLDGKLYVANRQGPSVSIITKQNRQTVSPSVSIPALTGNTTNVTAPTFILGASGFARTEEEATDEMTSEAAPTAVNAVYFQADTLTGRWRKTNGNSATLPPLKPGLHILYAFAADGQDSTTTNTGSASSPLVGKLSAYLFRVVPFTGTRTSGLITTPNAGGAASPYPSVLNVAGVPGAIEKISVRLGGATHGFPPALDILLVSPSGRKMILMSDAGGSDAALSDTTLIFDDAAARFLPFNDFIGDGAYRPTNFFGGAADNFPAPAPPAPYQNPGPETGGAATLNGTFAGETANGDWKLFVIDDTGNFGSGTIGNWSLTFQTTSDCPSTAYQISPSSANFDLTGGEGGVNVAAPEGCAWTAASSDAFVSIFSEAVGSGGGAINYTVAPTAVGRTGTMNIAGQTFTVNQAAITYEGDAASRPNGDGIVISNDVTQVQRFEIGLDRPFLSNEFQRADSAPFAASGDGFIRSDDVIQTQRYQIGLDTRQDAGGPTAPAAMSLAELSSAKSDPENQAAAAPREVRAESVTSSAGQTIVVNIVADTIGDESAYGFRLNFDQTKLTLAARVRGIGSLLCNDTIAGQLTCSVNNFPDNQTGSSTMDIGEIPAGNNQLLAKLTFTVAANAAPGAIPLTLSEVNASNDAAQSLQPITVTSGTVTVAAPTAASVSISGRVMTATGRGIGKVTVTITDERGNTRTTRTTSFGYFRFDETAGGETYVLSVRHKRHQFTPQVIFIGEERNDINFTALENKKSAALRPFAKSANIAAE